MNISRQMQNLVPAWDNSCCNGYNWMKTRKTAPSTGSARLDPTWK